MILDHGVTGNGRLLALVSPEGSVDWLCLPRPDSPSVFGRLLDEEKGGTFRFRVNGDVPTGRMEYVPNTNVLRTRFEHGDAAWDVYDFAPRVLDGLLARAPLRFIRFVVPVKGQARLRLEFDPRPDYGRIKPVLTPRTHGIELSGMEEQVTLFSNVPSPYILNRHAFLLDRPRYFVLQYGRADKLPTMDRVRRELDLTIAGWQRWASQTALPGFADDAVLRSALCLKLHANEDTGAIIAATTTSIPEAVGSERTWDYRFCWLRDAAFSVEALRRCAHIQEGSNFALFLRDVAEAGRLQPLYGLGGELDLPEELLLHLEGFEGSRPVRVGNAAYTQKQNDLMGELLLCLDTLLSDPRCNIQNPGDYMPLVERLVEQAIEAAPQKDTSIWEFRELPDHYTFSRAMCWVAIHRGARLAARLGRANLSQRWAKIAAQERETILDRAWDEENGMFAQAFGNGQADASNLLLPSLGLIDARDPRFLSTLEKYEEKLVHNGWMFRYVNEDDFGETTSAFTICSFWWAEALALSGQLDKAIALFERIVGHANPVGLFSEDIEPESGRLIGNMPQAYTHVGLINAAMTIGALLQAREGRIRAWS